MNARQLITALIVAALSSCGDRTLPPRGQILLFVDTDAPLGTAPGELAGVMDPAPLFDRLRVDVLDAEGRLACDVCRQDFVFTRDLVARGMSSVGVVVPAARSELRLRARLFRSVRVVGDDPSSDGTIDAIFALPAIGTEGVVDVTAFLPLDTVGEPVDLETPPRMLAPGRNVRATLHEGIQPLPCTVQPQPFEVCVPGGAYWMSTNASDPITGETVPERVVVVTSFLVERAEITVRELRASGLATPTEPGRSTGQPGSCTFTAEASADDDLPVTCVSWDLADRFCKSRGRELPSEAQFEFLMSGRRSERYVWGADKPSCIDVVHLRSLPGDGAYIAYVTDVCAGLGVGASRAGAGKRDVLHLPGGDVVDIAGNLSEWTRDRWEPLTGPCWGRGLFVDPICEASSPTLGQTAMHGRRGTGWNALEIAARATVRLDSSSQQFGQNEATGFRCVRPGR